MDVHNAPGRGRNAAVCEQCHELRQATLDVEDVINVKLRRYRSGVESIFDQETLRESLWRLLAKLATAEAVLVQHAAKVHRVTIGSAARHQDFG